VCGSGSGSVCSSRAVGRSVVASSSSGAVCLSRVVGSSGLVAQCAGVAVSGRTVLLQVLNLVGETTTLGVVVVITALLELLLCLLRDSRGSSGIVASGRSGESASSGVRSSEARPSAVASSEAAAGSSSSSQTRSSAVGTGLLVVTVVAGDGILNLVLGRVVYVRYSSSGRDGSNTLGLVLLVEMTLYLSGGCSRRPGSCTLYYVADWVGLLIIT